MAGKGASATTTQSVKAAKARLTRILKTCQVDFNDILEREAPRIYAEAVARTPYRTGRLEASVKVSVSKSKTTPGLNISASAQDPQTGYNYAAIQHENENFSHDIKGTPHYLSEPFEKGTRRIKYAMNKRLKEAAKS